MKTIMMSLLIGLSASLSVQAVQGQENTDLASEFYRALRQGDVEKVNQVTVDDVYILEDLYKYEGRTVFHEVCQYSRFEYSSDLQKCNEITHRLINILPAESDRNFRDYSGNTGLARLIREGFLSLDVLQRMEEVGFRLDDVDDNGSNLLHSVARISEVSNPELGAIIDYLMERGFDINAQNDAGETPIYIASRVRNSSAFYNLLERDANITLGKPDGSTPLQEVARLGDFERTFALIEAGADVNASDENGRTPLHEATDRNDEVNLPLVFLLIENRANYDAPDKEGWTPKFQMVKYANVQSNRSEEEMRRREQYRDFMAFIEPDEEIGRVIEFLAGFLEGLAPPPVLPAPPVSPNP